MFSKNGLMAAFGVLVFSISACKDRLDPEELAVTKADADAKCACLKVPHTEAQACVSKAISASKSGKGSGKKYSSEDAALLFAEWDRGSKCARSILDANAPKQ